MSESIYAQYDQVILLLSRCYRFRRRVFLRLLNPFKTISIQWKIGFNKLLRNSLFSTKRDFLTLKLPPFSFEVLSMLASKEELSDPMFKLVFSKYPKESIVKELTTQYPNYDFEKIKKIHDLEKDKRSRAGKWVKSLPSVVLAVSSIILNIVPQQVVESFQIDYIEFQVVVFWLTFSAFIYFGVIVATGLVFDSIVEKRSNYIGEVLSHVLLDYEARDS